MSDQEVSAEFSALVARHRAIVVSLLADGQLLLSASAASNSAAVSTIAEEIMLRTRIIAWQPANPEEAYRKLEHLVQAQVAGTPIDKMSVDIVMQSVESFIPKK